MVKRRALMESISSNLHSFLKKTGFTRICCGKAYEKTPKFEQTN